MILISFRYLLADIENYLVTVEGEFITNKKENQK